MQTPRTAQAITQILQTGQHPKVRADFAQVLETEIVVLNKDRQRLEWLVSQLGWTTVNGVDPANYAAEGKTLSDAWRHAIDGVLHRQTNGEAKSNV